MKKKIKYYMPVIQWPDYQGRIIRNHSTIKWEKPVHETIVGALTQSLLPMEKEYALLHVKDISKQESQNNFYSTI